MYGSATDLEGALFRCAPNSHHPHALMTATDAVLAYLTSAPTSAFRNKPVEILDHWRGQDNLLWRVRTPDQDAVVKLYLDAGQARSRRQHRGHELYAPSNLAPRPLWRDRYPEGLARQVFIYEWVDGAPVDLVDPLHMEALASSVARLHRSDVAELDLFSPHPVNLSYFWRVWQGSRGPILRWLAEQEVSEMKALFRKIWSSIESLMKEVLPVHGETAPAAIHGDLRSENTLLHRGQATLLDWELFGLGDPAQEVARFLFLEGQALDDDGREAWLEHYLRLVPSGPGGHRTQPRLADRIAIYSRIYPFHSLTFLLHGLQREVTTDPSQAAELKGNQAFLTETILSALQHTVANLLQDEALDMETLRTEIQQLLESWRN